MSNDNLVVGWFHMKTRNIKLFTTASVNKYPRASSFNYLGIYLEFVKILSQSITPETSKKMKNILI